MKELRADEQLVKLKPDKGNGLVFLDKSNYQTKTQYILADQSKFLFLLLLVFL